MKEPHWILVRAAEAIHKRQIAEHGGIPGIRDRNGLEAALARPRNLFAYGEDAAPARLAAAYAFGIAKANHPFNDGNKRTALVVSLTFLRINGFDLRAPLEERYDKFEGVAAGRVSEGDFSQWFEQNTVKAGKPSQR